MKKILLSLSASIFIGQISYAVASVSEAFSSGTTSGDFRLRVEAVDQNNALKDASAMTLRSRIAYTTAGYQGFSAKLEFEDSRIVLGQGEYTVGPTGYKGGQYSVIGDPETTEIDQAFLKYKTDKVIAKIGRQVIALDGHRFIGHVGWRQDRQTFDGLRVVFSPAKKLKFTYGFIDQRNRIFAEAADVDSADHLFNGSFRTGFGKLGAYAYLLENEDGVSNALDTYGVSLKGSTKFDQTKILYATELASQTSEVGTTEKDAIYLLLEAGTVVGGITTKLGYEMLGSDNGVYGFSTPLATGHKFNGWSDQFLGTPPQGLVDIYLSVGGKAAGGKWAAIYHDFSADESTATVDDLGTEINLLYARKLGKHYNGGIKYAAYSAGDTAAGKVDTDKLWLWLGASF